MASGSTSNEHSAHSHRWWLVRLVLCGVPLLAIALWFGRSLGEDWVEFERWIVDLGAWGPLVLVIATAILTTLMFPDTPLSMAAGALFGMKWGIACAVVGSIVGALLAFWVSRLLLRQRVRVFLDKHPRWSAIEEAAAREGLRLQLLIRLTPMPSATFSYIMGASRLGFKAFALACVGMIPGMFVEVYLGHVAGHAASVASGTSEHSLIHTAVTVLGLALAVVVMAYVTRLARRAIAASEVKLETDA